MRLAYQRSVSVPPMPFRLTHVTTLIMLPLPVALNDQRLARLKESALGVLAGPGYAGGSRIFV